MPHGPAGDQALGQLRVGGAQVGRFVGAGPFRREERALQVHAGHQRQAVGRAGRLGGRGQRLGVGLQRGGDEGRLEGHHARGRQGLGGAPEAGHVGAEEVHSGHAVDVQVDIAGHSDSLAARGPGSNLRHQAVGNHHVPTDKLAADERGLDSESHQIPLLVYTSGECNRVTADRSIRQA